MSDDGEPYRHIGRYVSVYMPEHELASKSGLVFEHRRVLFEEIGPGTHPCHWCERPVTWGVDLHTDHLGDRLDNDPQLLVPSCRPCNSARARGLLERRLRKRVRFQAIKERLDALGHWQHVIANNRPPAPLPTRSTNGLNETKVRSLRKRYANGERLSTLAVEFGVEVGTVRSAIRGTTWSHLSGAVTELRRDRSGGRPRLFTDEQEAAIGRQYLAGGTFASLAAQHGCATATIRDILKRVGVRGRPTRGSDAGRAKLTEAAVIEIRERHAAGERQANLARQFGMDQTAISAIILRKTWRHV